MEQQGRGSADEMHVPLRLLLPGYGGGNEYSDHRQLAVYNPPPPPPPRPPSQPAFGSSRFKLPEGWEVEEVPRADASRVDKYYYEPSTGHKFRSLREVERYINGEVYTPRRRRSKTLSLGHSGSHSKSQSQHSSYRKMAVSRGKMLKLAEEEDRNKYKMAIVPSRNIPFSSPHRLPEGWVVEEVPRNTRGGYVDKYYYEPGTGRKFRSLSSVDRHLADRNEHTMFSDTSTELREYNMPLSKAYKIGSHVKSSNSFWRNNIPREKAQSATFSSPPLKINWVIASPGGDSWNPFIGGSLVPESVKQQWCRRFMVSNDGRYIAPNFRG
ncbi:methyl-CpG-binding domain-containing protein 7-like [Apium graveolens]|uniref:methyl-CpG-binding domain-containing protein 7-like n=1 Tax=Apium graveolens TaxID=4045 RepID=UPI003D7B082E